MFRNYRLLAAVHSGAGTAKRYIRAVNQNSKQGDVEVRSAGRLAVPIPAGLRLTPRKSSALTDLLNVMAQGESIAMEGARLQATIAPTRESRKFLRVQARHERFHARIFETAGRWISGGTVRPTAMPRELLCWQSQTRDAVRANDFPTSVLIQQVFLEGLGHILLQDLERGIMQHGVNRLAGVRRLILSQEAEHHHFGIKMVEQARQKEPAITRRLLALSAGLFEQAHELLATFHEPFEILEVERGDYLAALRATIPAWLHETH